MLDPSNDTTPESAPGQRYVPNRRDVAFEDFGDEVVLIHFGQGRYFRLDEPARQAWSAIEDERGGDLDAVAAQLGVRYVATPDQLQQASAGFLSALLENELVVPWSPQGEGGSSEAAIEAPAAAGAPTEREPLRAPTLEVFTDLQDLLLLDPIHDVPESGWPHAQP